MALMKELFSADGSRLTQSPHKALQCPAPLAKPRAGGLSRPWLLFASLLPMQYPKFQPKLLPWIESHSLQPL